MLLRYRLPADLITPLSAYLALRSHGASLLLDPNDPQVKSINATIDAVAKEKWTSKADVLLKQIRAARRV